MKGQMFACNLHFFPFDPLRVAINSIARQFADDLGVIESMFSGETYDFLWGWVRLPVSKMSYV
jgi:hypothetical protein